LREVVPVLVELEVAVPRLMPACGRCWATAKSTRPSKETAVKTVPRNVHVVAQDELSGMGDLPDALSVALADMVGVAREGLLALSVATG